MDAEAVEGGTVVFAAGRGTMDHVRFRRAQLADVPALAHLRRDGEAGGASPDRMMRYLAGEHHPQQALLPRAMWLAADGDTPIGYIAGHLTRRFGCDGELQWIYVVPEHRRTRVASKLLRLLAKWFLLYDARYVCVDVGDDAARPFYRRHGAVDLSEHWMVWNDIGVVLLEIDNDSPASELDETVRCLLLDVAATVGAAYGPMVLETAAKLHALDVGDPSIKCVEDVQQYFHDTFVDTTWPACPHHPNHPLEYSDGFWCCPRNNIRITKLGELYTPPSVLG